MTLFPFLEHSISPPSLVDAVDMEVPEEAEVTDSVDDRIMVDVAR